MAIDVHAHFWTDEYLDKIAALGNNDTAAQRGQGAGDGVELDARLGLMDRAGVGLQVLSASPQLPHGPDKAAAVDAARHVNDQYADLAARHPGRFAAFASLPLPHLDASLAELARALDDLGMVGAAMTTTILGQPLVDSPAAELFAELDRRGTVLYLHPAGNAACTPLIADHHGTWSIGAPIEDTISVLHLITHGIPSRYPRMKILNSHLGGALPMLLQRMDNQLRWEAPETPETPSLAARRMWYDTVGHAHPPALRCAADSLGADRLVLGTDFPYQSGAAYQRAVSYLTTSGLPPGDAGNILSANAQTLLGLTAPGGATSSGPVPAAS
jgi:predicted TIM-barrel fold metal-dependent hydrolase